MCRKLNECLREEKENNEAITTNCHSSINVLDNNKSLLVKIRLSNNYFKKCEKI